MKLNSNRIATDFNITMASYLLKKSCHPKVGMLCGILK